MPGAAAIPNALRCCHPGYPALLPSWMTGGAAIRGSRRCCDPGCPSGFSGVQACSGSVAPGALAFQGFPLPVLVPGRLLGRDSAGALLAPVTQHPRKRRQRRGKLCLRAQFLKGVAALRAWCCLVLHAGAFPFWRLYRQNRREALGLPFRRRDPGGDRTGALGENRSETAEALVY